MAIYAIGDVQGCYTELCRLLEKINFDPAADTLWFCGDLVNRGPDSLQTLRFVRSLGSSALTVLGNHDLHLLALYHGVTRIRITPDLHRILKSSDCAELLHWLQSQPLLHYDKKHKTVVVHAGIHPAWGLSKARKLAREVETALRGENAARYFSKMYGNKPLQWSEELTGAKRLRFITNVFTRMRYFDQARNLDFTVNRSPRRYLRTGLTPWFQMPAKLRDDVRVLFGHWSTLPVGVYGRCFALDGGCVWGGHLVALRVDFGTEDWFFVDSHTSKPINTAEK
ncbi:MAG: symmetrical bis(5'-nucleosyl)-tetraphosphatase [Gammaproteobacteria bacterium]|nr:symmetrical bis(5'-nucleosyl)-tetraphosphatase [Gammaproteobacteria bacterium]